MFVASAIHLYHQPLFRNSFHFQCIGILDLPRFLHSPLYLGLCLAYHALDISQPSPQ